MLTTGEGWRRIVEVNPPEMPDMRHLLLDGVWDDVLVTDNVFGRIRVSPYAFGARIAHDVPSVHPTVVVSTRDRNILAIESEVRGALGNGVDSFFVVVGDTVPHIDHLSHHHEIVEHLRDLQGTLPDFEVGMPTRFRAWHFRKRITLGAQFFMAGPVLDPATVGPSLDLLELRDDDPPVYLMVIPAFSPRWVDRMETVGAVPVTAGFRERLTEIDGADRRKHAWMITREVEERAKTAGCAGIVLMGLKYETIVGEAVQWWRN
jgi:5,10-methylenetetrahydrofolate reductase